jgi:psiF repeat
MKAFTVLATAALLMVSANLTSAQTAPPPAPSVAAPKAAGVPPAPTAVPGKVKKAKVEKSARTPESLACSAEADKQALKGDPRKAFRKKCMADAKKGSGAAAAPSPAPAAGAAPAKKN